MTGSLSSVLSHIYKYVLYCDSITGLDYESCSMHILSVTATDRGPDSLPAHVNVVIRVDDVNDNAPRILVNALPAGNGNRVSDIDQYLNRKLGLNADGTALASVEENSMPGTFVAHVLVSDADGTRENSRFRCAIDDNVNFRLQEMYSPSPPSTSGQSATTMMSTGSSSAAEFKLLTGNTTFDRERRDSYRVAVTCRDFGGTADGLLPGGGGSGSLTSSVVIRVLIGDVNDNAPVFGDVASSLLVRVAENGPAGEELIRLHATDVDAGSNGEVRYHLNPADSDNSIRSLIGVDESTGAVRTVAPLDREATPVLEFNVLAVDNGRPRQSASIRVKVIVLDLDDERPTFTERFYSFSTVENQPAGTEVGSVSAVDRDEPPFDRFMYTIDPAVGDLFAIDPSNGRITTKTSLDREGQELHQFFVWAKSERHLDHMTSAAVTIRVDDVDDNRPRFVTSNETVTVSSFTPPGYRVARLAAVDKDSPVNANLRYVVVTPLESTANADKAIRQPLFEVDSKTGEVRVSEVGLADIEHDIVTLVVEVREQADDVVCKAHWLFYQ
jgi:hypothetical protein